MVMSELLLLVRAGDVPPVLAVDAVVARLLLVRLHALRHVRGVLAVLAGADELHRFRLSCGVSGVPRRTDFEWKQSTAGRKSCQDFLTRFWVLV